MCQRLNHVSATSASLLKLRNRYTKMPSCVLFVNYCGKHHCKGGLWDFAQPWLNVCNPNTVFSSLLSPEMVLQSHEMLLKVLLFICGLTPQRCLLSTSPKCCSVCQTSVGRINLSSCATIGLSPFDTPRVSQTHQLQHFVTPSFKGPQKNTDVWKILWSLHKQKELWGRD